jgi:predicted XRE-type DNA-binding protein
MTAAGDGQSLELAAPAAQIIHVLDARHLTVRAAAELTGTAAADFSRIRRAKLDRFTNDRLMGVPSKLDQRVEVVVRLVQIGLYQGQI